MGTSRVAGARLLGFLSDAQSRGLDQALRSVNLERLIGRSLNEIYIGLADFICPDAGTIDEGVAREAYIETIAELAEEGMLEEFSATPEQIDTFFEIFATHAIEARLCNDIGTKLVTMPESAANAHLVEQQLREFIQGGVRDALAQARDASPSLTSQQIEGFVERVYETAFSILRDLGETEANE